MRHVRLTLALSHRYEKLICSDGTFLSVHIRLCWKIITWSGDRKRLSGDYHIQIKDVSQNNVAVLLRQGESLKLSKLCSQHSFCLFILIVTASSARLAKTVPVELYKSWLPDRDIDICLFKSQIDRISFTRLLQMDIMLISGAIMHHCYWLR